MSVEACGVKETSTFRCLESFRFQMLLFSLLLGSGSSFSEVNYKPSFLPDEELKHLVLKVNTLLTCECNAGYAWKKIYVNLKNPHKDVFTISSEPHISRSVMLPPLCVDIIEVQKPLLSSLV